MLTFFLSAVVLSGIGGAASGPIRVCDAELNAKFNSYYKETVKAYGELQCSVAPQMIPPTYGGPYSAFIAGVPHIFCHNTHECASDVMISTELLNYWVQSKGLLFTFTYTAPANFRNLACQHVPPQSCDADVQDWISDLREPLYHRLQVPIQNKAHINSEDEMRKVINATIVSLPREHQIFPLAVATFLMDVRLRAPSQAPNFEAWLKSNNFGSAISLADMVTSILDQYDPRTNDVAQRAINDILNTMCTSPFDYTSPYPAH